jgi:tetratricopeptide (TPR) repeat protein
MKRDFRNHLYLGNKYKELRDYEKAEQHYRLAKAIAPFDSEVLTNLCSFCHHMHQFDLSFKCAELAVKHLTKPDAEVYFNYALLLGDKGESEKSQYYFYKAIEANPKYKVSQFGLGMELIRNKKYTNGWKYYETRMDCFDHLKEIREKYGVPYWDGSSNKKIVLYSDQGFGDFIFALRYLPELTLRNIKFYIDSDYDLAINYNIEKYDNQEIDHCCSFMSLPYLINTENFCTGNYKFMFKKHDTKNQKKKIGIIFAGNPSHENDYKRSAKLSNLKPIFEKYDCYLLEKSSFYKRWHMSKYVNLYDCNFNGNSLKYETLNEVLNYLYDLDCLITVDTGIAHLAGVIQMPTYVLLDHAPDFRWGMNDETTPYYNSWHLCRQNEPFDWESAVNKVLYHLS